MHDTTPKKSPHNQQTSPRNQQKSPRAQQKSPDYSRVDENRRSLGRSSSQHTLGPNGSKVRPTNTSVRTKEKLNATVRVDPNISIDNANRSGYSLNDKDARKTQSDSKNRQSTVGRQAITSAFKNKAPMLLTKPILSANSGGMGSPKSQAAKQRLNINSSPVLVKKKI